MLNELRVIQHFMDAISKEMNRSFEEMCKSIETIPVQSIQGMNTTDNGSEIIVTAKVPPNTNVNLTPNRLDIFSQNKTDSVQANTQNSFYQSFYQSISLSGIDPSRAKTSYNNGVLEIRIHKLGLISPLKNLALPPGRVSKAMGVDQK